MYLKAWINLCIITLTCDTKINTCIFSNWANCDRFWQHALWGNSRFFSIFIAAFSYNPNLKAPTWSKIPSSFTTARCCTTNVRIDAGAHPHPVDVLTPFSREKSFVGRIQNKVEADEAAPQVKCVWMLAHYLHCMSTPPSWLFLPPSNNSEVLKWLEYACCPPSLLDLTWPLFEPGGVIFARNYVAGICSYLISVSDEDLRWGQSDKGGYKCLQLSLKATHSTTKHDLLECICRSKISTIWNFITLVTHL